MAKAQRQRQRPGCCLWYIYHQYWYALYQYRGTNDPTSGEQFHTCFIVKGHLFSSDLPVSPASPGWSPDLFRMNDHSTFWPFIILLGVLYFYL